MVIMVHGLWMTGLEMTCLRRRLERAGFRTIRFAYSSITRTLEENSQRLFDFCRKTGERRVHFVCHSLGGIVLCHMLNNHEPGFSGRAVLLGSPLAGSRMARILAAIPGGRLFTGRSMEGLIKGCPEWNRQYEAGLIAGTFNLGTGLLLGGIGKPGDGVVLLTETRAEGIAQYTFVHANHIGLLFSRKAAEQTVCFLRTGDFQAYSQCPGDS